MNECSLADYKVALLKVLNDFAALCDQHSLSWFASGGTAIGAVRHKGFIPWDDDLDIYMPERDYLRFIQLRHSLKQEGRYEILDWDTPGYHYPFAKFCDAHTTVVEYEKMRMVLGVYIDIFPLYELAEVNINRLRECQRRRDYLVDVYGRSFLKHRFSDFGKAMLKSPRRLASLLLDTMIYSPFRNCFKRKCKELEQEYCGQPVGEYYFDFGCCFRVEKTIFRKEWFDGFVEFPFEHLKIRMPKGYHELLTLQYGDYMTPPAKQNQSSTHGRYYVNLAERLTLAQIDHLKSKK